MRGEAAETVNADAARGREVVSEAVCSITALASDVETAAEVLRNLERHSEPIGAVLDVIRGIAEANKSARSERGHRSRSSR